MKGLFATAMMLVVSAFAAPKAHAYFPVAVQTFFTPQQVTFQVENIYAYPIYCEGQFFATTYSTPSGEWLHFVIGPVFAGQARFAAMTPPYVVAGDYFTSIPQTVAYCNYY